MFSNESVFERSGSDTISAHAFNFVIGLTLFWGFFINFLIVQFVPVEIFTHMKTWIFLLIYFAFCFGGVALFEFSDNPILSFLGYNLVVVPFGFIINLVVSRYSPGIVLNAILVTGAVTFIMMLASTMFPSIFESLAPVLFISLLFAVIMEFLVIMITGHSAIWIDWIVAIIFCGYIGVDWYRANNIPKTVDNAIDSAASLYMDIINLFLRILSILGKSRR